MLQRHFDVEFTFDCFATTLNTRCKKFFSYLPQMGTCGINFFAQSLLPAEKYWICPPPKLVLKALKKVLTTKNIVAVFCVPVWKHKNYWSTLTQHNQFVSFVQKPVVFSPVFVPDYKMSSTIFRGKKNFQMLSFFVST